MPPVKDKENRTERIGLLDSGCRYTEGSKDLHHRLRLHCVEKETSLMDFVIRALRERLDRLRTRTRGAQKPPAA